MERALTIPKPPHLYPLPRIREAVKKSVHGSTGSPRTERRLLNFKYLAVRPELVEGRSAKFFTPSGGEGRVRGHTKLIDVPLLLRSSINHSLFEGFSCRQILDTLLTLLLPGWLYEKLLRNSWD